MDLRPGRVHLPTHPGLHAATINVQAACYQSTHGLDHNLYNLRNTRTMILSKILHCRFTPSLKQQQLCSLEALTFCLDDCGRFPPSCDSTECFAAEPRGGSGAAHSPSGGAVRRCVRRHGGGTAVPRGPGNSHRHGDDCAGWHHRPPPGRLFRSFAGGVAPIPPHPTAPALCVTVACRL